MSSEEDRKHNEKLLKAYQKHLRALELKRAEFGIHTPTYIDIEIEETSSKITSIQASLSLHSSRNEQKPRPVDLISHEIQIRVERCKRKEIYLQQKLNECRLDLDRYKIDEFDLFLEKKKLLNRENEVVIPKRYQADAPLKTVSSYYLNSENKIEQLDIEMDNINSVIVDIEYKIKYLKQELEYLREKREFEDSLRSPNIGLRIINHINYLFLNWLEIEKYIMELDLFHIIEDDVEYYLELARRESVEEAITNPFIMKLQRLRVAFEEKAFEWTSSQ